MGGRREVSSEERKILGQNRGEKKKKLWAGRMCFWFIPKRFQRPHPGALVATGSL